MIDSEIRLKQKDHQLHCRMMFKMLHGEYTTAHVHNAWIVRQPALLFLLYALVKQYVSLSGCGYGGMCAIFAFMDFPIQT